MSITIKVALTGSESRGFRRGKKGPIKQGITFEGKPRIFQSENNYNDDPFYGLSNSVLRILDRKTGEATLLSKNGKEIMGTVLEAVIHTLEGK